MTSARGSTVDVTASETFRRIGPIPREPAPEPAPRDAGARPPAVDGRLSAAGVPGKVTSVRVRSR
ncbi:hypothetical protein ACWG5P_33960 [Streptomyces prasinus]